MRQKIVIIGEAPKVDSRIATLALRLRERTGEEGLERLMNRIPITGRIGRRLAGLCGLDYHDFLRTFDRRNLLNYEQGPLGKGDDFDPFAARRSALLMTPALTGREVVLLGRRVERAFLGPTSLPYLSWTDLQGVRWATCPHPSGINRWWNEPANRSKAEEFWNAAV